MARSGYGPEAADLAIWPLVYPGAIGEPNDRIRHGIRSGPVASTVSSDLVLTLTEGVIRAMLLSKPKAGAAVALAIAALAWMAVTRAPAILGNLLRFGHRHDRRRAGGPGSTKWPRARPSSHGAGSWTRTGGRCRQRPSA